MIWPLCRIHSDPSCCHSRHVCSLTAVFTRLHFVWQETYTEIAGMQRFGAFYMDYLYTMENSSGRGIVWVRSPHQICLQALPPFLIFLAALLCSFFCLLWSLLPLSFPLFSVKQAPWRVGERACLVWVSATWSLTLLVLTLTLNLPGGQLSQVFSLHWCIFEFLSPRCLLKHCVPGLCTCKLLKTWKGSLCLIGCHSSWIRLKSGNISHSLAATLLCLCLSAFYLNTLCNLVGIHRIKKIFLRTFTYIFLNIS